MHESNNAQSAIETAKRLFNEMAEEYDRLHDLWYQYTFSTIDAVLVRDFRLPTSGNRRHTALDIGCGTGIQSVRLASLGYKVIGIDIADKLINIARDKLASAGYRDAEFHLGNAESLPFDDGIADCINCCGPTLSFVPNWRAALSEMSRCLKPGGRLLLEVEGKWNLDLFWEILNALACNVLSYDERLLTALSHLLPPWHIGHHVAYSFKQGDEDPVTMNLRLFAASEIKRELQRVGLAQQRRWGLHVLTNLIPSTVLHSPTPWRSVRFVFSALAAAERGVNSLWPFNAFGCSLLLLARKRPQGCDCQENKGGRRDSNIVRNA